MLDVSLPELTVIAAVALLVLGPERLPKVARVIARLLARARRAWDKLKDEIEAS